MAELIDRAALIDRLKSEQATSDTTSDYDIGYWNGLTMAQSMTRNAPTIHSDDPRPRGRWIKTSISSPSWYGFEHGWRCSNCGYTFEDKSGAHRKPTCVKFCLNCGSKMEE